MRRGFSLIEVIIAVIILAILSGMIIPRVTRTTKAEHDNAIEKVRDLLSMYAFRSATSSSQQIALWQDPETGWLALLFKGRDPSATSEDGEKSKYEWTADSRIPPVVLPRGMEISDLLVDGGSVSGTDWIVPTTPGGGRPSIELRLVSGTIDAVLRLDSNSMVPIRIDAGGPPVPERKRINLDEYGTRGEKW